MPLAPMTSLSCNRNADRTPPLQAKTTKSPIVVETTTEVDVSLHHFSMYLVSVFSKNNLELSQVAIYKRLGFEICGETSIESPVANAWVWLMRIEF